MRNHLLNEAKWTGGKLAGVADEGSHENFLAKCTIFEKRNLTSRGGKKKETADQAFVAGGQEGRGILSARGHAGG